MSRRASRHDLAAARKELPIYTYRDELVEAIQNYQCLIVVGDTGSGKTTQLPQYILESLPAFKSICITQPRRIAAISSARRVAEERGSRLGQEVGYSIRFERSASNSTKLLYVTDGTLLRTVATDPTIKEYDMVMLDEAHERSLETDVLFGLLRRACRLRPELKVVVMSATLDIEKFSEFFGDAPVFSIPGRMYAVDIMWQKKMKLGTAKATFVRRSVDTVLHIHKNEEPGDVLIFLTGQQEIEMTTRLLMEAHEELDYGEVRHRNTVKDMVIYPIYSALETLEQRSIFDSPPEGVRKIVIATNIAQTSVTIPGIRYVVDSGFVKQKMYDPRTGVDALIVVPISQAAATQRAGRAGRTASGKVYRLYSREAFEDMEPATVPEIQRSSLIGTVLALKKMGIDDIMNFEFIDPPDPELVIGATKQLFLLGAVDEHGHLTSLGRQMSEFPISPYLSRVLISAAIDFNCSYEVLIITSMLSVEEIFSTPRSKKKQEAAEQLRSRFNDPSGDHLGLLRIYQEWRDFDYSKDWAYDMYIHYRALSAARKVKDQLSEIMERLGLPITSCDRESALDGNQWKKIRGGHQLVNGMLTSKLYSDRFVPHFTCTRPNAILSVHTTILMSPP
ncbi:P-loop containing nucleoside triphosphate hydrolase protein [Phlyctochytrium arcticum]|nr:P-loop containing nucleoside triphosphate hydrolase protein [Phlyctochytrium arcticum]